MKSASGKLTEQNSEHIGLWAVSGGMWMVASGWWQVDVGCCAGNCHHVGWNLSRLGPV